MTRRVAITGAGAVSALGHNWEQIKSRLLSLKNCVRYMHEWDQFPELQTRLASPIDDFICLNITPQKNVAAWAEWAKWV